MNQSHVFVIGGYLNTTLPGSRDILYYYHVRYFRNNIIKLFTYLLSMDKLQHTFAIFSKSNTIGAIAITRSSTAATV